MLNANRIIVLGACALGLAACAGQGEHTGAGTQEGLYQEPYRVARATEPTGSAFNRQLYEGYVALAAAERKEYDWSDSDRFARKALAAAADQDVTPDALDERMVTGEDWDSLLTARSDLMDLFRMGARDTAPLSSAEAQLGFDCWIQEQEENRQPDDIAACRERFLIALAETKTAVGLPSGALVVYFKTGSAELATAELQKLMLAAAEAKGAAAKVLVSGHTDDTGTSEKNEGLSEARAQAVTALLISAGIKAERIRAKHYGAARPAVVSEVGKAEPKNRRVEVQIIR